MSDTENKNLVELDSLSNYLKGTSTPEAPKITTPQISLPSTQENKSTLSVLEETNAKIKMMEVGGSIVERLLQAGNQIADKIIKAKQMQFMAEQQQREVQEQKQLGHSPSPNPINPNVVYNGFVQILEFFLSVDKDLKVDDLLTECKEKKELALQMISKFLANQQQAEAQPQEFKEPASVQKKEDRLKNGS